MIENSEMCLKRQTNHTAKESLVVIFVELIATLLLESHLVLLTERSYLILYQYAAPPRNYSSQIHFWTEKATNGLANNGLTVLTGTQLFYYSADFSFGCNNLKIPCFQSPEMPGTWLKMWTPP